MRYKRFLIKEQIHNSHDAHKLLSDLRKISNNNICYIIHCDGDSVVRFCPFDDVLCRRVDMPDGSSSVYLYDFSLKYHNVPYSTSLDFIGLSTYSSEYINASTIMVVY